MKQGKIARFFVTMLWGYVFLATLFIVIVFGKQPNLWSFGCMIVALVTLAVASLGAHKVWR